MDADAVLVSSAGALCLSAIEIDGKPVGGRAPQLLERIQQAAWQEALDEVAAIKNGAGA